MDMVTNDNLAKGQPKIFARNKLEIMVAPGNPEHIKSVSDLANKSSRSRSAPRPYPADRTPEIFKKAGVTVHPVSEETSVSGVVTKVSLGEADAGVVYVTDVKESRKQDLRRDHPGEPERGRRLPDRGAQGRAERGAQRRRS